MGWKLLQTASSQEAALHPLPLSQAVHLVLDGGPKKRFGVVASVDDMGDQEPLARIDVGPWGLKMVALGDGIQIKPRHGRLVPTKDDLPIESYDLQPASADGRVEVLFLREDDRILLSKTAASLKVAWDSSEIQVNSSINGEEIPESNDVYAKEDEETEDEDLDRTVTTIRPLSHSTPIPSIARSDVIQETPTADRVNQLTDVSMSVVNRIDAVENTPPPEDTVREPAQENFPMAPTKPAHDEEATEDVKESPQQIEQSLLEDPAEAAATIYDATPNSSGGKSVTEALPKPQQSTRKVHPAVLIPKKVYGHALKRPSPIADNESSSNASSSGRPSKRNKKNDDKDSDEISKPAQKKKKRVTMDVQDTTPKSTRGSQPSTMDEGLYKGLKPRLALSNSGIPTTGNAIKFLKKHGGNLVENVKGEACNILCVKNGTLKKSMKLLLCVALGVPIVSDEWLLDSAKDGRFLDLEGFRPHFPAQESDWNFSFEDIWTKTKEVFQGHNIYFTPALKATYKPFSEVEELCKAAGARRALSKLGKEVKDKDIADNTILLALNGDDDEDAVVILNNGYTCYTRDLLTLSILRGKLDLESEEFRIKPAASNPPKKKGRSKKS